MIICKRDNVLGTPVWRFQLHNIRPEQIVDQLSRRFAPRPLWHLTFSAEINPLKYLAHSATSTFVPVLSSDKCIVQFIAIGALLYSDMISSYLFCHNFSVYCNITYAQRMPTAEQNGGICQCLRFLRTH